MKHPSYQQKEEMMSLEHISNIPNDIPDFWDNLSIKLEKKHVYTPRFVIHGGYGKRNMGDDALFHSIYSRVRKNFPNARITAVCHGPQNILPWYDDIAAYHFKSISGMFQVFKSDVYIIGGGGIINKINTYSGNMVFKLLDMKGKYMFIAALVAQLFGASSVFYGIGAESFPDGGVRILARLVLNHVDTVSVRDPLSLKNLKQVGIHRDIVQVWDPALSLIPDTPESACLLLSRLGIVAKGERSRPVVGLNLRYVGDPAVDNENSLDETAKLVRHLTQEREVDVLFLSISQHPDKHLEDDLDFGQKVRERLRSTGDEIGYYVLEEYPHPRVFMALLEQMDYMILSRLHSIILGTKLGIPILAISYDDKVTQFVQMSGQDGMLVKLEDYSCDGLQVVVDKLLGMGKG